MTLLQCLNTDRRLSSGKVILRRNTLRPFVKSVASLFPERDSGMQARSQRSFIVRIPFCRLAIRRYIPGYETLRLAVSAAANAEEK